MIRTAAEAIPLFVDAACFQPIPELGGKPLSKVLQFGQKEDAIVRQAAGRLAAGNDPGIIPERFLISASRMAVNNRLARPGVIHSNFYEALGRR